MTRGRAVAAACALAAALAWNGTPPEAIAQAPIRMGNLGNSADAALFIAEDKGYFKEQGIAISLERFGVGADQMALLGAGRMDIASGGLSPTLFNAIARGLPIVAVADHGSLRTGFGFNVLVVRRALLDAGQYRGPADLRGRVLASPNPASVVTYEYALILKGAGLTLRDVRVETVPFPDQVEALANGKVDATITLEPLGTVAEARGAGRIMMTLDRVLPDFPVSLIYYNTQWARGHPEDARRWMVAYVKGLRYYNRALHDRAVREDVIAIMAAHTPIKDRQMWDRMIWPGLHPDGLINTRAILDYEHWLINDRQITTFVLPAQLADLSYVRYAVSILGPAPR